METLVLIFVNLLGLYALIGVLFSLLFVWKGLKKVDSGVEGTSFWFKLIIFPGLCAFWPIFISKWIKASKS